MRYDDTSHDYRSRRCDPLGVSVGAVAVGGARQGSVVEMTMRRKLIVVMLAALSIPTALMLPTALLVSSSASAQVGGIRSLTPGIGATSPLGGVSGSPNSPLGIPLGATELSSPGLSPVPAAASDGGSTCSATSGMSETSSIYDGGGIAVGSGANSTPMSASCGASANAIAPSSPSQLSASPNGISPTWHSVRLLRTWQRGSQPDDCHSYAASSIGHRGRHSMFDIRNQ